MTLDVGPESALEVTVTSFRLANVGQVASDFRNLLLFSVQVSETLKLFRVVVEFSKSIALS